MKIERLLNNESKPIKATSLPAILDGIVKEVALEIGLTENCISNITASQFKLLYKILDTAFITNDFEELPTYRLQYLGAFKPSIWKFNKFRRLFKMNEIKIENKENV
jgi:hypothetical protein